MLAALRAEYSRFYRRKASYLGFALLLGLAGLVTLGAVQDGKHAEYRLKKQLQSELGDGFIVAGKIVSAPVVPRIILFAKLPVYVFLASLIAMTAGGAIATEYSSGTLRTVLTRPVRRTYVVLAKWVVNSGHAVLLTLFLGAAGLGLGYLFLGSGDLVWMIEGLQIVPEAEAVRALAVAYALQGLSMVAVASLALFASSAVSRGATAAGITVSFLLISGMLGVLPLDAFKPIQPYLLTTHMSTFEDVLLDTVKWSEVRDAALWVAGHAAAGLLGAIITFGRREIRC